MTRMIMEKTTELELNKRRIEEDDEIDLKELFFVLLNHWKLLLISMLIGATMFGAYHTFLLRPSYQADVMIYITNTDSLVTFSDLQLSAELTEDYALIINSRTVLNKVIDELQLDLNYKQLRQLISVTNPTSSHIIDIKVTCDDLELSRNIANALLNVSVKQIYQVIGSSEPNVIDYSEAEAVEEVTPGLRKYLMIGLLLGFAVSCAFLIVRALLDTTMKTEDDIEKYLQLPVLATVPYYREKR